MPINDLSPIQLFLEELLCELKTIPGGQVADYIPELTRSKPEWLGIVIATVDGHIYQVGDSREKFTIQSISKAITYGLALEDVGLESVLEKVGVEPSGEAFNSISLEQDSGRPMNPMINAGAIATTGIIKHTEGSSRMDRILKKFSDFTGNQIGIDEKVYLSEKETGHRNRAIAHLLYGYGILDREPEDILDLYFRQCSILVNARDLAVMGATLANDGVNPITNVPALKSQYVEKVLSVMTTCGMYDFSGGWIFNVGMPAKSGVGGGIMAVLPGQFGLGVFSPPLDEKGNSLRGIEACKRISNYFKLHLFNVAKSVSASSVRFHDNGKNIRSRKNRSPQQRNILNQQGQRIFLYELQGELMFGASESISKQIFTNIEQFDFVIFEMKRVFDVDNAAILIFAKMANKLVSLGKSVFFTQASHNYQFSKKIKHYFQQPDPSRLFQFVDTDRALEFCEDQIIAKMDQSLIAKPGRKTIADQVLCTGLTDTDLKTLESLAENVKFPPGQTIFNTDDEASSMFFILAGEIEITIATKEKHVLRLGTLSAGQCFGEMSLVNGLNRSANIVSTAYTECLEIPFDTLEGALLTKILINLASHLAEKLNKDTKLLQDAY